MHNVVKAVVILLVAVLSVFALNDLLLQFLIKYVDGFHAAKC